ncbi:MAG: polysulfide reductase NrfD [Actinomycetota bacterium]|nr:polysulfide reductase NrfD [Actinomycetota bacterium]
MSPKSRGERPMVPDAEPRSYYGLPILNQPVWEWPIPVYFFTGGTAGAAAVMAAAASAKGDRAIARHGRLIAAGAVVVSMPLLVKDLGRPGRFLNMLRVFKPTSPMSVGSWLISGFGAAVAAAAAGEMSGRYPVPTAVAGYAAGLMGLGMSTYTAVLLADTAVPVWHEARVALPFEFAGSSAAAAGGLAMISLGIEGSAAVRRFAALGAALELAAAKVSHRRMGLPGIVYKKGTAGRVEMIGSASAFGGAVTALAAGRFRTGQVAAGALLLVGALCKRWSVYEAGKQSAADPSHTVALQRGPHHDGGG